jgi:hypothetical protein
VHASGLDNETNPGLGLHYTFHENERGVGFAEAGFYQDSGSNLAKLAGLGYQYKLGARWRLGGAVAVLQSPTYNRGDMFLAPFPVLTYDLGAVTLNAIYIPRYGDYNHFAVFGFYLGVPLTKIGSTH